MSHRFTVDYPEDLAFVQAVFEALYRPGEPPVLAGGDPAAAAARAPTSSPSTGELAGVNWYRHHLGELRTVSRHETQLPGTMSDGPMTASRPRRCCEARAPGGARAHRAHVGRRRLLHRRLALLRRPGGLPLQPGAAALARHPRPTPGGTTSSSPRATTCRPSTARWPSWATSSAGAWPATWTPTTTSTGTPTGRCRGWSSTPARWGTCCRWRSGVALDIKLRGGGNRVFVLLGDGELDEGSVWEAALVASAKGLDNLVAIVDRNGFQANLETEQLIPLEPLEDKLRAFGFARATLRRPRLRRDGRGVRRPARARARPTALIARTVRGQGAAQPRAAGRPLVRPLHPRGGARCCWPSCTAPPGPSCTRETLVVR